MTRRFGPPIVTMEKVSAGYGERTVLSRIDLTLSNDDRIGLLGANGNGKSTFAKLVGGRPAPFSGPKGLRRRGAVRVLSPPPDHESAPRRRAHTPVADT